MSMRAEKKVEPKFELDTLGIKISASGLSAIVATVIIVALLVWIPRPF